MSRRYRGTSPTLLGPVVVALALAACGSGAGGAGGGQDLRETPASTVAAPAPTPAPTAPPGPGTSELLALLEQGRASTFHARWVARQNQPGGAEVRFELWNRPPAGRLDLVIGSSGLSSSAVRSPAGVYSCARNGQEPWGCQPGGDVEPAGVILDAVRDAVAGLELAVSDEVVVGRPARCFTDVATGQEALCTTTDGIPLRVLSGPQRIEILLLERTVSDTDLQAPGRTRG